MNGKNVMDFVDPDIAEKLDALEREEQKLEVEGYYNSAEEMVDSEEEETNRLAEAIKEKKKLIIQAHRARKMMKNRPIMPRTATTKSVEEMEEQLSQLGLDTSAIRARSLTRKRKRSETDDMDIDSTTPTRGSRSKSVTRSKSVVRDRSVAGLADTKQQKETQKQKKLSQRKSNLFAKVGESDRSIKVKRPKHLFSSKMSSGKKDWR
jgi:nucleolar GTP-binding protein